MVGGSCLGKGDRYTDSGSLEGEFAEQAMSRVGRIVHTVLFSCAQRHGWFTTLKLNGTQIFHCTCLANVNV